MSNLFDLANADPKGYVTSVGNSPIKSWTERDEVAKPQYYTKHEQRTKRQVLAAINMLNVTNGYPEGGITAPILLLGATDDPQIQIDKGSVSVAIEHNRKGAGTHAGRLDAGHAGGADRRRAGIRAVQQLFDAPSTSIRKHEFDSELISFPKANVAAGLNRAAAGLVMSIEEESRIVEKAAKFAALVSNLVLSGRAETLPMYSVEMVRPDSDEPTLRIMTHSKELASGIGKRLAGPGGGRQSHRAGDQYMIDLPAVGTLADRIDEAAKGIGREFGLDCTACRPANLGRGF